MSYAATRGARKGLRTLLQLVAAGGLTALVEAVGDLSGTWKAVVLAAWTAAVAAAQNYLEAAGTIPTVLPTPPAPTKP